MRPAGLPGCRSSAAPGETRELHERGDALLGDVRDARAGGDAELRDILHAVRHAGDPVAHDVSALRRLTLRGVDLAPDGATVAAQEPLGLAATGAHRALQPGAGLADVALELVAGGVAATLEAPQVLADLALGGLAGAELVDDAGRHAEDAITRLERRPDVHERGALDDG